MSFLGTSVLEDVTLAVEPGARIGVIGRNGSGKSTLLRVLAGRLEPTSGRATSRRDVSVGHQEQELAYAPGATVREEMRRVFRDDLARARRLHELEERLAHAPDERALAEYERLQRAHEAADGYAVDRRIETVLSSLGLPPDAWDAPVERFSGGERNVLGLARVLLSEPDVMLLDEPSNHLDMDGVEWFTAFLRQTPAAVVMVSHNRHLLDASVTEIWEVARGRVTPWTGNYTAFRKQKEEALALQERQWRVQQQAIERLEFQARRLRDLGKAYDDPGQAKRAKAMFRRAERMAKVERPERDLRRFHARLESAGRHGRIALVVKDLHHAYGDRVIFDGANLEIEYGERVCLVGPNGSGKSTLFRRILTEGSWENPVLRLGKSVKAGEYRQLHDALDPTLSLQDWAMAETGLPRSEAAGLLHRFLFTRDDLDRPVGTLSGGEKSRLQLARLVHERVNLLFLDEPTNHLDLEACEQLESMLETFDGTLFVISHDRYFLDRLVTRVVEVVERKLVSHPGGFPRWWRARAERRGRSTALEVRQDARSDAEDARREREEKKAREREVRKRQRERETIEREIEALEEKRAELSAKLEASYSSGAPAEESRRLHAQFEETGREIDALYGRWEALS